MADQVATDRATEPNAAERQRWNDPRWAEVWPRREALTSSVTTCLLDHLPLGEGDRVLEVGSGGGAATFALAGRVGSGAVTAADVSAPLCDLGRRRARERGADNVTFVVADAQRAALPGGPFDAAASQFGVMFFDDPAAAFGNIRDHVRPGGALAFACWRAPEENPWLVNPAVAAFLPTPPAPVAPAAGRTPPGPFSLCDVEATRSLLEAAGWEQVSSTPYDLVVAVPGSALVDEDALRFFGVPEDRIAEALGAVAERLRPLARSDGDYDAPLAFQVVTAANPR